MPRILEMYRSFRGLLSTPQKPFRGERPRTVDVALLILVTVPFYLSLDYALWGSEDRWCSISKTMLETGNWLEPRLCGEFYGDKPLLSYWAVVVASWAFGTIDEWVARMPSAVAGSLTVLLTGWMAARLLGRRQALLSGWVLATTIAFVHWSRSASADLLNVMFVTAAIALYVEAVLRFRPWHVILFFLLLALGGHAKGTPAIILPLGVVGADVILSRRLHLFRKWGWIALGIVLSLGLFAVPFVLSYWQRGDWELVRLMWKENIVRAVNAFDHKENVFLYTYILPAMFLPWSLWLLGALGWAARKFSTDPGYRFALIAFLVIFLAFTASESRRSYYILPIFPLTALLVAGFARDVTERRISGETVGAVWWLFGVLPIAIFGVASLLGALFLLFGRLLPPSIADLPRALPLAIPASLVLIPSSIAILVTFRQGRYRRALHLVAGTALLVFIYHATGIQQFRDRQSTERGFASRVHDQFPEREIVYYTGCPRRLRYYLGPGPKVNTSDDLKAILASTDGEILIACDRDGYQDLQDNPLLDSTEVLRATRPAVGSLIKAKDKYFLFRCRKR